MIHPLRLIFTVALAVSSPAAQACQPTEPVMAETSPLTVEDVKGFWAVAAEGQEPCRIALNGIASGEAYGVYLENCTGLLGKVRGWRLDGARVRLIDGDGQILATLRRDSVDRFVGQAGSLRLTLERAPVA